MSLGHNLFVDSCVVVMGFFGVNVDHNPNYIDNETQQCSIQTAHSDALWGDSPRVYSDTYVNDKAIINPSYTSIIHSTTPSQLSSDVVSAKKPIKESAMSNITVGMDLGYGNTDWSQLTYTGDAVEVNMSAPTDAYNQGMTYGFDIGYKLSSMFSLESNYIHFSKTKIKFYDINFYPELDGKTEITSQTEVVNVLGRFHAPVFNTPVDAVAMMGPALTHRKDILFDDWQVGATFGFGVDVPVIKKTIAELAFQFTTGYGQADEQPADYYVPFTYFVYLHYGVQL